MYRIVASDLDGTLLNPEHKISENTKKTLQALIAQGVHFAFATGRHHLDVKQMRDNMNISAFMITSNGARVHNKQEELIIKHDVEQGLVAELANIAPNNPLVTTNIYSGDEWFINREDETVNEFFQVSKFNYAIFDPKNIPVEDVAKVYFCSKHHDELLVYEKLLNERYGNRLNVSFSSQECLEVMTGGVSKGAALNEIAKIMGYTLDDCIAFGDGMNDIEMLSMVGKGCIMGNASPRVKESLPHIEVIGYNKDDAVSSYLKKLYF